MTPRREQRLGTWLEVLALAASLVGLVVVMERLLARPIPERWLRVVLALACAELALITAAIVVAVACKLWAGVQARRRARVRPIVQAALSTYLAGRGDVEALVALGRAEAVLLEEGLEDCLRAVTGEPRASAVRLVAALGLLARWRRALGDRRAAVRQRAVARLALLPAELRNDVVVTALRDADAGVRRAAVRALVPTADAAAVGEAIRLTAGRSLTERALLVDALRRNVHRLAPDAFAPALAEADEGTVVATLEMVRACGRVLSMSPLAVLLRDERAAVRAAAARTVPYATGASALADELIARLSDDDLEVRAAATSVLGQLHVEAALGPIGRGLRSDDPRLAVVSAHALAQLGREGRRRLEAMLLHGEGVGPLAAAEALGQALIGRAQGLAS